MRIHQIRRDIMETASLCRSIARHGVYIERGLPTVCVSLGPDNDYFFQEHEADRLLEEADAAAERFDVTADDYILWSAQGW